MSCSDSTIRLAIVLRSRDIFSVVPRSVLGSAAGALGFADAAGAAGADAAGAAGAGGTGSVREAECACGRAEHALGPAEKMSRLRKTIAKRMVESLHTSAIQLTATVEVDLDTTAGPGRRTTCKKGARGREPVRTCHSSPRPASRR